MARKVFFDGRVLTKPGSYSKQDASALEAASLASVGVVLILGTAEGGQPYTVPGGDPAKIDRFQRSSSKSLDTYRSGDLREAIPFAFNPSNDPQIPGGASEVWTLKVNPATPSTSSVSADLGPVATLSSEDYGAFTEQVNYTIGAGTDQGRVYAFEFEDIAEGEDNVGGAALFTLQYTEAPGNGWDTMTAAKRNGGLRAWGTRADIGLDSQITAQPASGDTLTVNALVADAGRTLTIYGLAVGGAVQSESFLLVTGVNAGTRQWSAIHGVVLSGSAAASTMTVTRSSDAATVVTMTGQTTRGIRVCQTMFVANAPIQLYADASTPWVTIVGRNAAGAVAMETIQLSGTTAVQTATSWQRIDYLATGAVAAARTVTIAGMSISTTDTVQKTLLLLSNFVNARSAVVSSVRYGFTFTLSTSRTSFDPADLDFTGTPVAIQSAAQNFTADLWAFLDLVNNRAQLVEAEALPWVAHVFDVTISPLASTTYTITLDGVAVAVISAGGSPTAASIATLFEARVMLDPRVSRAWRADVLASGVLRLSTLGPAAASAIVGANLAIAAVSTASGVRRTPSLTSDPVYLSGGSEGTTTVSDWIGALDFAQALRPNKVCVVSDDPAVWSLLDAHLDYMAGPGKHEREGCVGIVNSSGGLASLSEIRDAIALLNNRNLQAVFQEFDTFATDATLTTFGPRFLAVLLMGAKAGAGIGGSLTHRLLNVQGVRQHADIDVRGDGDALIDYGAVTLEPIDGRGYQVMRNVTTYLASDSLVYSEAHVNEAANYATLTIREGMEFLVGRKGFAQTKAAAIGAAEKYSEELMNPEIGVLADFRNINVDLTADVLEMSEEIAPVISLNFILNTLHLVLARQAA